MFKSLASKTIIAAAAAMGTIGVAQASWLDLPESVPIPLPRATALQQIQEASIPRYPVVAISTTAQAIPAERQNVRVIGTRFLPKAEDGLALKVPGAEANPIVASLEAASMWVIKTASAGVFSEAVAAQDQTMASLESDETR